MCLDCGCKKPDDRHGDDRHIVMQDLLDAGKASDQPVEQILQNIEQSAREVLQGKLQSEAMRS